jgi:hypothetical protein
VRALKSCGFRNAAIGLAAAWLLEWVLVMALVFFALAASMSAAARAAKCRTSPAAGTNASRFMTRPRAATWDQGTSGPAADRHPRPLQVPPRWGKAPALPGQPCRQQEQAGQLGVLRRKSGLYILPVSPGSLPQSWSRWMAGVLVASCEPPRTSAAGARYASRPSGGSPGTSAASSSATSRTVPTS